MTIGTLATALEREHRQIDAGIEEFTSRLAGGETTAEPLLAALRALRRHIYLEEAILFPPLRDAGMVGPIFVMLREHGEMWQTMDALDAALAENSAGTSVLPLCARLVPQLETHNTKEEPILYTQADSVLSDAASASLQDFLETGAMPEGWVCERARTGPAR